MWSGLNWLFNSSVYLISTWEPNWIWQTSLLFTLKYHHSLSARLVGVVDKHFGPTFPTRYLLKSEKKNSGSCLCVFPSIAVWGPVRDISWSVLITSRCDLVTMHSAIEIVVTTFKQSLEKFKSPCFRFWHWQSGVIKILLIHLSRKIV